MRKYYIDYLRSLAAFAVICIHVTGFINLKENIFPAIVNSSFMWAVPVFILITGSVSIGKENLQTKDFIIKKYQRFLIPFIFWNAFYFIAYQVVSAQYTFFERFVLFTQNLYTASHLWYLVMFLFLIPLLPYLNKFVTGSQLSKNELLFFSVLMLVSLAIIQIKDTWHFNWINIFNPFIFIVLLGYIIDQYVETKNLILIAGIGLLLLVTGLTLPYDIHFFSYFSITNTLIALAIFCFFKWLNISKLPKVVKLISDNSFGIYLIHFILIEIMNKIWGINYYNFIPFIIFVFVISLFVSWVLGLNRWGKKLC